MKQGTQDINTQIFSIAACIVGDSFIEDIQMSNRYRLTR